MKTPEVKEVVSLVGVGCEFLFEDLLLLLLHAFLAPGGGETLGSIRDLLGTALPSGFPLGGTAA